MITPRPSFTNPHALRMMRDRALAAIWQRCRLWLAFILIIFLFVASIVIAAETAAADVPPWVLRGIAKVETSSDWRDIGDLTYRDKRVGADGEVGPWQLSPDALRDLCSYDKRDRIHRDVVLAESLTRAWLLRCHAQTGNWFDAVRIYHTGPDGDRRRGIKYAERVLAAGITTN